MSEIKIQIIFVDEWGSFLFINDVLYKSGTSLESFSREIFHLVRKNKHFIMHYNDPIDVKFKKFIIDKCPYNTFYDVEDGIHIDTFMQWFEKI